MIDLEKIAEFAKKIHMENNDGHGFDHIERVVALANKILLTEPSANRELVLAACYLHDTYDEKLTDCAEQQKIFVSKFLNTVSTDSIINKQIFFIIDNMSFSSNIESRKFLDINGQIVQDADRLDAMGAWGIARTLEYGWAHGRALYDPSDQPVSILTKADYHQKEGTTLNHFYEKLFLLEDLLNTDEAKNIGKKRNQIMHDFVTAIEQEYDESH